MWPTMQYEEVDVAVELKVGGSVLPRASEWMVEDGLRRRCNATIEGRKKGDGVSS